MTASSPQGCFIREASSDEIALSERPLLCKEFQIQAEVNA